MNGKRTIAFIPKDSIIHNLNPITKLVFVGCAMITVFLSSNTWFLLGFIGFLIAMSFLGRVQREFIRLVLGIVLLLIVILVIIQTLFYPGNETLIWEFKFLKFYYEGFVYALLISFRLIALVAMFLLLILTTDPKKLIDALQKKGLNSKFAYLILATLQIVPQMSRKSAKIREAQVSRGLKTEGNMITRFKAFIPLFSPLISGSISDIEERALALEIRGFNSECKKTSIVEVEDREFEKYLRYGFVVIFTFIIVIEVVI